MEGRILRSWTLTQGFRRSRGHGRQTENPVNPGSKSCSSCQKGSWIRVRSNRRSFGQDGQDGRRDFQESGFNFRAFVAAEADGVDGESCQSRFGLLFILSKKGSGIGSAQTGGIFRQDGQDGRQDFQDLSSHLGGVAANKLNDVGRRIRLIPV